MANSKPTVYLLYGDDELAMADFVARLREKLGDPSTADLNTVRFAARIDRTRGARGGVRQRSLPCPQGAS